VFCLPLAHSDYGAVFRDALKDVIWSNTICPDGTNSDAHGGTCERHL